MVVDSEEGNALMMMVVDLIIMAPWLIHFSITFFFSGSVGVSFGPPGISTWIVLVMKMKMRGSMIYTWSM